MFQRNEVLLMQYAVNYPERKEALVDKEFAYGALAALLVSTMYSTEGKRNAW